MEFTKETARGSLGLPEKKLCRLFGERITGAYCASYLSLSAEQVVGASGLPFYAPLSEHILNCPETARYLENFPEQSHLFVFGETIKHYTERGELPLPRDIEASLREQYDFLLGSAGMLDENGDHILDLKSEKIGTHFDVNLLIGNRIGFPSPLGSRRQRARSIRSAAAPSAAPRQGRSRRRATISFRNRTANPAIVNSILSRTASRYSILPM